MTRAPEAMRELARATAQASDGQLMKLVGALDAMPVRGQADDVLRPVRARLRALQPPRPLNLARVLFLPLDPLLVSAASWRPGSGLVPRSAIAPLAAALAAAAPALANEMRAALLGRRLEELHLVGGLGRRLWPAAAALAWPHPVPGWAETGLSVAACAEILDTARALWRHAEGAWRLRMEGPLGPPEALARPILQRAAAEGAGSLALLLAAALPFAALPSRLAAIAAALRAAPVAEQALERFLQGVSPELDEASLGATARSAERLSALLEDLHGAGTPVPPARAQRLHALRQSAGAACLRRLESEAGPKLGAALDGLATAPSIADAAMEELESSMAALRALADAARRLGSAAAAEAALRPALATLRARLPGLPAEGAGFLRADALRLVELLDGAEGAARLLAQPGASTLSQ